MPDPIERKRLKKKMLDRWENEGGRIARSGADATQPTRERKGKSKQRQTSRGNAKAGAHASSSKRR